VTTPKTLGAFAATMIAMSGCGAKDGTEVGSGGAPGSSAGAGGSVASGGIPLGGAAAGSAAAGGIVSLGGTSAANTSNSGGVGAGGGVPAGGSMSGGGASIDCPEGASAMCGMVAAHNAIRAAAPGANPALPPVTWDATLAAFAQAYASTCPTGHNPNRTVEGETAGENMYFTSQRNLSPPAEVVQAWASEQANYAYPANTCGGVPYTSATFGCSTCPVCGHYTQIVWRTTIKVGCGVASGCSGNFPQVWVCDYLPAGNMVDRSGNLQLAY